MHIFEVIFDNTGFEDIGLQAAMVAASTETSLGGHRCMAKLARPSKRPAIEIAIDHDTKADAPSNRHHQEMLIWQTPTEEFLVLALTNGEPGQATTPLTLDMFNTAFANGQYGYGSTIATSLAILSLFVTLLIFRSARRDVA